MDAIFLYCRHLLALPRAWFPGRGAAAVVVVVVVVVVVDYSHCPGPGFPVGALLSYSLLSPPTRTAPGLVFPVGALLSSVPHAPGHLVW